VWRKNCGEDGLSFPPFPLSFFLPILSSSVTVASGVDQTLALPVRKGRKEVDHLRSPISLFPSFPPFFFSPLFVLTRVDTAADGHSGMHIGLTRDYPLVMEGGCRR